MEVNLMRITRVISQFRPACLHQPNVLDLTQHQATCSHQSNKDSPLYVSAKVHTFPPSKQVEWEYQLLCAFISTGCAFNSISDPEVQKLFHDFIPGATF